MSRGFRWLAVALLVVATGLVPAAAERPPHSPENGSSPSAPPAPPAASPSYVVKAFTSGHFDMRPHAINDVGQIVGYDSAPPPITVIYELNPITGIWMRSNSIGDGKIHDINDAGQAVGYMIKPDGDHAFLWEDVTVTDLTPLLLGDNQANAINSVGQVVGYSRTAPGHWTTFLWENGVATYLGPMPGGGSTFAQSINDAGQIVGFGTADSGWLHAVLWENGVLTDLGTFGGEASGAYDINNSGQIVGYSTTDPDLYTEVVRAILWEDNVVTELGTLGGTGSATAFAINDAGQIVGESETASGGVRGFVWQDGVMTELPPLDETACLDCDYDQSTAVAINSAGWIVGRSFRSGVGFFESRATLWIPVQADLAVTKVTENESVQPGDHILYRITVENVGSDLATGVTLTDSLPADVSFDFANTTSGTCAYDDGTHAVTCDLGTLDEGASAEVFLNVVVDAAARGSIENTASVTADQGDPDTANNSSTETVAVQAFADLSITKVGSPDPVLAGSQLIYTIQVANHGDHIATGVTVTDQLPPETVLDDITNVTVLPPGPGCALGGGLLTCSLADMNPFEVSTVTVPVDVLAGAAGWIANTASVAANEVDLNPTNNSVSSSVFVTSLANTPVGSGVWVTPADTGSGTPSSDTELLFAEVTQAGSTTVAKSTTGPPPPFGFSVGDPAVYYDFTTDALFVPPVRVCINYLAAGITFPGEPRIFHFVDGTWVDETEYYDPVAGIVCGDVSSLSPFALFAAGTITVPVDIKPGNGANTVNLRSKGVIPLAVLTDGAFDATTVLVSSVRFGPDGASAAHPHGHIEDVDGDGDLDLMLHFGTQETGLSRSDTQACLVGQTSAGVNIEGCDAIRIVGG